MSFDFERVVSSWLSPCCKGEGFSGCKVTGPSGRLDVVAVAAAVTKVVKLAGGRDLSRNFELLLF